MWLASTNSTSSLELQKYKKSYTTIVAHRLMLYWQHWNIANANSKWLSERKFDQWMRRSVCVSAPQTYYEDQTDLMSSYCNPPHQAVEYHFSLRGTWCCRSSLPVRTNERNSSPLCRAVISCNNASTQEHRVAYFAEQKHKLMKRATESGRKTE